MSFWAGLWRGWSYAEDLISSVVQKISLSLVALEILLQEPTSHLYLCYLIICFKKVQTGCRESLLYRFSGVPVLTPFRPGREQTRTLPHGPQLPSTPIQIQLSAYANRRKTRDFNNRSASSSLRCFQNSAGEQLSERHVLKLLNNEP
jgi:hypothetical protein